MPKQRVLPNIILGIMACSQTAVTGKYITDYIQREIGEFWQVAHSQVYPELKRMTDEGLITCHRVPNNDKEKEYHLNEAGRARLDDWLAIPNREIPLQKDSFSLKMFFIRQMDDERLPVLFKGQIEVLDKHLRHLKHRRETLFDTREAILSHYGHYLILERAIARNQAQLDWLRATLAQFDRKVKS